MNQVRPGQAYKSYRKEIVNPKPKYHLYLADDIVFLINSDKDIYDFSLPISKNDCEILTKDCFLQLKKTYRLDNNYPIISISDMSDRVLAALSKYLKCKQIKKTIPKIYVDRSIGIIEKCLESRNSEL